MVFTDDDDFYGETLTNYIKRGEHVNDFGVPDDLVTRQDQRMQTEITMEKPKIIKWNKHLTNAFKRGVSTVKYCKENNISRSQLYRLRGSSVEAL